MTKYFLHGGMTGVPCENNDNYYKEIMRSVSGPVKVLLVYFATENDKWNELAEWQKNKFMAQACGERIAFEIASDDVEKFAKQVKWCDIVYIRGGSTPMLQMQLERVSHLPELFKGKVVAGSSAGAIVLAKYYYDQDNDQIFEGLDLLHVKMITHYLSTGQYETTSKKDKLKILENYKEKMPVYAIKETEFITVLEG